MIIVRWPFQSSILGTQLQKTTSVLGTQFFKKKTSLQVKNVTFVALLTIIQAAQDGATDSNECREARVNWLGE